MTPLVNPDKESTEDLRSTDSFHEANKVQIKSVEATTPSKSESSQQGSHSLIELNNGDQRTSRLLHDVVDNRGLDTSEGFDDRSEQMPITRKPAHFRTNEYATGGIEEDNSSCEPRYQVLKGGVLLDSTFKSSRRGNSPSRDSAITVKNLDDGSTSEIQSIVGQFDGSVDDITGEETSQKALWTEESYSKAPKEHTPRRSSLEPLRHTIPQSASNSSLNSGGRGLEFVTLKDKIKAPPVRSSSLAHSVWLQDSNGSSNPNSSNSKSTLQLPEPDPESDLPFDFHRFLEQLRHRTADPVAKFLRSFLIEFGKKQWMVHEQVKIINDFLIFITTKMAHCDVWRGVSDAEFDNAKEGMEKLVMNRLYSQTFSPAIPAPTPVQTVKGKRKAAESVLAPGRKGQHQEDIERDAILAQKVRIYGWVQEKHLDIPSIGDNGGRFLILAQQGKALVLIVELRSGPDVTTELLKIKTYRAPRDKVICVLNCCKVIFGKLSMCR